MMLLIDTRGEWADMLTHVPVSAHEKAALRAKMSAPGRHYHDMRHIALLWERHKRYGADTFLRSPLWHQRIASAIAFHDVVYHAGRKDNEALSVSAWLATEPNFDSDSIEWVADTIAATANHLTARPTPGLSAEAWAARQWVLDLDLTPLGEKQPIFDANTLDLRREFAHLSDQEWETRRVAFLKGMLAHDALYRTPVLHEAFEAQARANLGRVTGGSPAQSA
jgi:predicted metal-dependent HD superfamily phosphohydrolase